MKDYIYDLILPLSLYSCSNYEKIEENITFLMNRYMFYIDKFRGDIQHDIVYTDIRT